MQEVSRSTSIAQLTRSASLVQPLSLSLKFSLFPSKHHVSSTGLASEHVLDGITEQIIEIPQNLQANLQGQVSVHLSLWHPKCIQINKIRNKKGI